MAYDGARTVYFSVTFLSTLIIFSCVTQLSPIIFALIIHRVIKPNGHLITLFAVLLLCKLLLCQDEQMIPIGSSSEDLAPNVGKTSMSLLKM